jgi:hypothetical protein
MGVREDKARERKTRGQKQKKEMEKEEFVPPHSFIFSLQGN